MKKIRNLLTVLGLGVFLALESVQELEATNIGDIMRRAKEALEVHTENETIRLEPLKRVYAVYSQTTNKEEAYISKKEVVIIPAERVRKITFTADEKAQILGLFDGRIGGFWDQLIAKEGKIYDPAVFLVQRPEFWKVFNCTQSDKFITCSADGQKFASFMFEIADSLRAIKNKDVVCLLILARENNRMVCLTRGKGLN